MKHVNEFFKRPYIYIFIVLIGVALKFNNIQNRFFWDDEICTILHTSGIPMGEYERDIPVNTIIHRTYFDSLMRLNDRDLKMKDQFTGLMKMPQLTPGHYYYFIFLTRIFGDGPMTYRYFSLIVFLVSIVFLFLFVRKFFSSDLLAWIVISLYAVSPFFQYYAQEARYYVLWSLAIVLMHYIYIVALEKKKLVWWVLYVVFGFFAIHTTILFYITLSIHLVYAIVYYRPRLRTVFFSQFLILLTSLPWLIYIFINHNKISDGLAWQGSGSWSHMGFFPLLLLQLTTPLEVFIHTGKLGLSGSPEMVLTWIYRIAVLGGVIIFFIRATNKQRLFIGLMLFLGMLALLLLDLVRSTGASNVYRYHLMNFAGIIIMVGYAFREGMIKQGLITGILFLAFISASILSSYRISEDLAYGNRNDSYLHLKDSRELFSGNEKILIISDFQCVSNRQYTMMMSLLNASKDPNIDLIYARDNYVDYKHDFDLSAYDKIYGMYLSRDLLNHLRKDFTEDELVLSEKRIAYGFLDWSLYTIRPDFQDHDKSGN